jgi:hypothetical protein
MGAYTGHYGNMATQLLIIGMDNWFKKHLHFVSKNADNNIHVPYYMPGTLPCAARGEQRVSFLDQSRYGPWWCSWSPRQTGHSGRGRTTSMRDNPTQSYNRCTCVLSYCCKAGRKVQGMRKMPWYWLDKIRCSHIQCHDWRWEKYLKSMTFTYKTGLYTCIYIFKCTYHTGRVPKFDGPYYHARKTV